MRTFFTFVALSVVVVLLMRCKVAQPDTVDELLRRSPPNMYSLAQAATAKAAAQAESTASLPQFAASIEQAFRAGSHLGISGCRSRGPHPVMYVHPPHAGMPTLIQFLWPLPDANTTTQRYLLLSSSFQLRPFVQGCVLVGPSQWVLPVTQDRVTIPAAPASLIGTQWWLQAMQLDTPTATEGDATLTPRVRLSTGWWAQIGA